MLLDVTPDQSMVDEGVAREVINRIQKLRKKVGRTGMTHNKLVVNSTIQCLIAGVTVEEVIVYLEGPQAE